ncbi:hypothetical protein Phum_PHUM361050 [Pediculus humanus corporis]|uniref:Uncharacterized protein n=1 Tax=Pediculus humanus subsp. corporis TaxID=121224 RepID=E0VPJ9_PEDHC|nr:uncharacterized protein Phum_PHUM361050 [Pediculus humanus corporis]EEB15305.1 hypothetical protein Phum_PHUM361050 [Pediculus humanus corporis]
MTSSESDSQQLSSIPPFTCLDDTPKVQEKVVYALARLQERQSPKERRKAVGVTSEEIVEYLIENFQYLDGDIESQVMTALLSCVKSGIICARYNGKYLLLGANPKIMISKCITRTCHGSKCCCFNMLNFLSKIKPENCCSLSMRPKKSNKKKLVKVFDRNKNHHMKQVKKSKDYKRKKNINCLQNFDKSFLDDDENCCDGKSFTHSNKCKRCDGYHTTNELSQHCEKCFPGDKKRFNPCTFSPREETFNSV